MDLVERCDPDSQVAEDASLNRKVSGDMVKLRENHSFLLAAYKTLRVQPDPFAFQDTDRIGEAALSVRIESGAPTYFCSF